jgi:bifunctional UDP-N-acetylglucosamine pyrophosphorylase/glucosamine-1-phosphate N-acetyltransferase
MSLSIVILAAGYGTRMKSKTPKVLHKISGKTMIEHTVAQAQKLSDDITVVLYFEYEKIQAYLEEKFSGINYVIQDVQNYPGTGGAMRNLRYKHDEVLILNGDMPLVTDEALAPILACDADIVMSVIRLQDPSGYGRVVIRDEKVQKIIEQKDCSQDELAIKTVNAGVYKVKKEVLNEYIPKLSNDNAGAEYYLTDIVEAAVSDEKSIKPAYVQEVYFKGVNSKYDLANAETIMQNSIKKAWMQEGCIMRLPETIYIEKEVVLKGECIIENNVSILGKSILENAHIKAGSVVEDAHIVQSSVGPMARIRPHSTISDSHVGNFVEVKKSNLKGVKAGHLSYLGDSDIDEGTNIGAGVITCNYDGKNKYPTRIGKNVFVGSDTQIIAPCQIEDDTMIAAGTTLTTDVKKGELAISRAAIKKIKNFYYKFFK